MILVTGATGFIGNHLARFLAGRRERLRLLARPGSDRSVLQGLDADVCTGDLGDENSLREAVAGCRTVYHVAADYRLWSRDSSQLYETNVAGTRNMLAAAKRAGVERFVFTSSVGTIVPSADGSPVTEKSSSALAGMTGHYKRSKYLAEREALRSARDGLPVVIVNPTAPVGEGDFKPTPTGRIIQDFLAGKMPAYIETGLNLVDVRDVARGHWLAAERGRVGQRYLLGCENLTLRQVLQLLAGISERQAPRWQLPYLAAWLAGATSTAWSGITGKPPRVPIEGVRMARRPMYADCTKARCELGFDPVPVRGACERAVEWFQERA